MTSNKLILIAAGATVLLMASATTALACKSPAPKPVEHKVVVKHTAHSTKKCPQPTPAPTVQPQTPVTNTNTPQNQPGQVLTASTTPVTQPKTLPDTGAGLSALIGLPSMVVAGRAFIRSRR